MIVHPTLIDVLENTAFLKQVWSPTVMLFWLLCAGGCEFTSHTVIPLMKTSAEKPRSQKVKKEKPSNKKGKVSSWSIEAIESVFVSFWCGTVAALTRNSSSVEVDIMEYQMSYQKKRFHFCLVLDSYNVHLNNPLKLWVSWSRKRTNQPTRVSFLWLKWIWFINGPQTWSANTEYDHCSDTTIFSIKWITKRQSPLP